MSMLRERLQVLINPEQRERLVRVARDRGTSVGAVVREAIDVVYPSDAAGRLEASRRILAAAPMDVPADVGDLLVELDDIRAERT